MDLMRIVCLILALSLSLLASPKTSEIETTPATTDENGNTYESVYSIPGLPQQPFLLNQHYRNGDVTAIKFKGTRAFLIKPKQKVDPQKRWIWIAPLWVAFKTPKDGPTKGAGSFVGFYVEQALAAGFHVAGLDVGTSCGSPKGAELYQAFYQWIVKTQHLNPKVRLFGVSNGGLISYAWAFRHPKNIERIFCVYPVTDMRTWPGLAKVAGPKLVPQPPDQTPGRITPEGLKYDLSPAELENRLVEFNPLDNLAPLAKAKVKIFHIHGDKDALVPMPENSVEFMNRYRALGGEGKLDVLPGLGHGGKDFFQYQPAADFLTAK